MFDKAEYWRRRWEGRRGQGDKTAVKFTPSYGGYITSNFKGLVYRNRADSRRKQPNDPSTTKKRSARVR